MRSILATIVASGLISAFSASAQLPTYTNADFARVPKLDAHVHANVDNPEFLHVAVRDGFTLLSINVDYPDFPPLAEQAAIAQKMHALDAKHFQFATTFSMQGFGLPGWSDITARTLANGLAHGALAVKVWKNIGMVAKDPSGHRVFLDDPRFDPVMRFIEAHHVPLIAHQGEPYNCWLPLDQMTTDNDRSYFREHPEYYMALHPEQPGYADLMEARDRFVARNPQLSFVGAHLGSLEWSVEAVGAFLDRYPNATVDLAARMSELQYQSRKDPERVRAFFIKYQDRLLYGTDLTQNPPDKAARAQNPPSADNFEREADEVWRADWRYLATGETQPVEALHADIAGLALPRTVIDKLYHLNAERVFHLPASY